MADVYRPLRHVDPATGEVDFIVGDPRVKPLQDLTEGAGRLSEASILSTIATGVDAAVPGAVGDALRDDETIGQVIEAAVGPAVDEKVSGLDLITRSESTNPALGTLRAGLAMRQTAPCRLVFLGSSTTYGTAATSEANRFVNRLTRAIQAAYPSGTGTEPPVLVSMVQDWGAADPAPGVHGYNGGAGGSLSGNYTNAPAIARIAALDPRMVLHMIGANDWSSGVTPATYRTNLQAKIDAMKAAFPAPCVHVLAHSYPKNLTVNNVAPWSAFAAVQRQIAAADPKHVAFIDLAPYYEAVGIPGDDPLNILAADNVHQRDAGHAMMADLLREALGIPGASTAVAPAPPPEPVTFLSDSFTDADGTALDAHTGEAWAAWSYHPANVGDVGAAILDNRVAGSKAGTARYIASHVPPSADYEVEGDWYFPEVPTSTTRILGMGGRYSPTVQAGYYVRWVSTTKWILSKFTTSQITLGTSEEPAIEVGQTVNVRLAFKGDSIKVYADDVEIISANDSDLAGPGRVVVMTTGAMSATLGVHLDNIKASA